MSNIVGIDKGCLKLAKNVLERAGKVDIVDEIEKTTVDLETILATVAKRDGALYMKFVTSSMIISHT